MKKLAWILAGLAALLAPQFYAAPGCAESLVTWVSATGDDSNTNSGCQATAPCQSFSSAMSQTAGGGEVNCIGPVQLNGAAVAINGPVTIDCHGTLGGVMASGQANGFVIDVPDDVVTLRGLTINGSSDHFSQSFAGSYGVLILAAALVNIEDCVIENFALSGINVTTSANTILNIRNTTIRNVATGISYLPTGGVVNGSIDRSMIAKVSGNGITTNGGSVYVTVTGSVIANAVGAAVSSGGSGTVIGVSSSSISNNRTAFATAGGVIRISRNVIYDNTTNFSISGGTIATSGDNDVAVNGSTVPNGTITQQ